MASQTVPDSDREHRNDIRRSTGGQSMTLAMGKEEDKKRGRGERRAARAWIGRVKGNFPPHCACVEIGFVAEGLPTIGPLVWCMRRVKGYFFPSALVWLPAYPLEMVPRASEWAIRFVRSAAFAFLYFFRYL
ncbi:hypothetical protein B296_00042577 [Ensete ventricosum]|uniref:Uncharacterized protein n=1 Tax=Ensete ventricosum TaxID=4639 RepID=A0A426ZI05_ENSVE|nr:hypothetical protein B296_00042577 [Ensete ventricosum]